MRSSCKRYFISMSTFAFPLMHGRDGKLLFKKVQYMLKLIHEQRLKMPRKRQVESGPHTV